MRDLCAITVIIAILFIESPIETNLDIFLFFWLLLFWNLLFLLNIVCLFRYLVSRSCLIWLLYWSASKITIKCKCFEVCKSLWVFLIQSSFKPYHCHILREEELWFVSKQLVCRYLLCTPKPTFGPLHWFI